MIGVLMCFFLAAVNLSMGIAWGYWWNYAAALFIFGCGIAAAVFESKK